MAKSGRVQGLLAGSVILWALAAGAGEPTSEAPAWDQEEVSAVALELDAILQATSLAPAGPSEGDAPSATRGADQAERLVADVEELTMRLTSGDGREATRELMSRIENRLALLAQMGAEVPVFASPEDAAGANEAWSELRAYYKERRAAQENEAIDEVIE